MSKRSARGQNITEYLILVAGVLTVLILAANPRGIFTRGVNKSIDMMFDSVEDMATVECLGTTNDVNGQWNSWSAWAGCGWDATSSSCLEYSTHTCNNPEPKCGGSECALEITSGYTTPLNRTESKSQACYMGSWTPGTCPASSCTGACGSTVGTCTTAAPTCDTGCCDPADKPATTIACTKLAYPDVWSALGFGACSVSCDAGISSQTVTCSGMCCDAAMKPPTRRACVDGCCAQSLYIGYDIENDVNFTATFGPAANGESDSAGCPPGYAGTPTWTCTATASGSCTGNDSYVPPASCYTIGWGGLTGECQPADCPAVSVDAGYGRTWNISGGAHGTTATLTCSDDGWSYTGTASYDCWLGSWRNLNAGCIPNCPAENSVFIGEDLYVTFAETVDDTTATLTCSSYDEVPAGLGTKKYVGSVTRDCGIAPLADGTWGSVSGACSFKPCPDATYMDPNGFVTGTFPASPHGTPQTLDCATIDSRYTGTFNRTCTYGDWLNPTGGCTAEACADWTTNVGGVNITFTAAPHGTVQPQDCAAFDNTYTGTVNATCDFGNWINLTGSCSPVSTDCPQWDNIDAGNPSYLGCLPQTPSGQTGLLRRQGCSGGFMCPSPGYYTSGSFYIMCNNGVWDPVPVMCTRCTSMCPAQTVAITSGTGNLPSAQCLEMQSFSCPSGYTGSDSFYCNINGTWSRVYSCTPQSCIPPACAPTECGTVTKNDSCGNPKTLTCGNGTTDCCTGIPAGASYCTNSASGTTKTSAVLVGPACGTGLCGAGQCNYYCPCPNVRSADGTSCGTPPGDCTGPDGSTILHGNSKTYYSTASVPCGSTCASEERTCNNGTLSSPTGNNYANASCAVEACCVPKTCADLGLCSGASITTSYSDGCTGTISCGPCPQWVTASPQGTRCDTVCAGVGLSSGLDWAGNSCRSKETCSWDACTDGEGGTWRVGSTCGGFCIRFFCKPLWYDCRNRGQTHDCDDTDKIKACYCI